MSKCYTGGGTPPHLTEGESTHAVVSVCGSVDWPHTFMCACEGGLVHLYCLHCVAFTIPQKTVEPLHMCTL